MNIWDHSTLSVRKFGGKEKDYYSIHKFIDSSKMYHFNPRHRLLLHNLYGIELTVMKFGDYIQNSDHKTILVRDIAAEHCKEDLSNKVPSLHDWLAQNDALISPKIHIPKIDDQELKAFVLKPYFKSNLKSSLLITLSNFGVSLVKDFLSFEKAELLHQLISKEATIQNYLTGFQFHEKWQFSPSQKELLWLKEHKQLSNNHHHVITKP